MEHLSPLLQAGIQTIEYIQSWQNPFFTSFFKAVTFLGDFEGYIIILAIFLWAINYRQGLLLAFVILWSASVNTVLKEWWQVPRPFVHKPELAMIEVGEFSTPSGHAQGSASFWSIVFCNPQEKQKPFLRWSIFFAIVLPFLIGFSRIYLGVHYPSDVLLGWLLGAVISLFVLFFYKPISHFLQKQKEQNEWLHKNWQGLQTISLVLFSVFIFLMSHANTAFLGLTIGVGMGAMLLQGNFDARLGSWKIKVLRVFVGSIVMIAIMLVLKKTFPDVHQPYYLFFRTVRYFMIGFCASWLLPQMFLKIKWAQPV